MMRVICLIMTLGVFACADEDMKDLQQFIKVENKNAYPINDKMPQLEKVELIKFTQQNGRDPFYPPRKETVVMGKASKSCPQVNLKRKKQALEMNSLANLIMRGTLKSDGELVALIQSPDGEVHQVKLGDYLGLNHGKVVRIIKNKVELLALSEDKKGCWSERETQITLLLK